jgi:hypothetical protein
LDLHKHWKMDPPIELKLWLDNPDSDQAKQECKRVRTSELNTIFIVVFFVII